MLFLICNPPLHWEIGPTGRLSLVCHASSGGPIRGGSPLRIIMVSKLEDSASLQPPPPPDFALSEPLPQGWLQLVSDIETRSCLQRRKVRKRASNLDATRTRGPRRMATGQAEEKRPRQKSCASNKTQKRLENARLQFLAKQFGRW